MIPNVLYLIEADFNDFHADFDFTAHYDLKKDHKDMAQSTTAVYCIVSRAPNYWSSAFVVVPNAHTLKNVSRRNRAVGSRWPRRAEFILTQ